MSAEDTRQEGMQPTSVLLAGVGGQGTILAADVLAKVAVAAGYEVKLSEIHGMAQRGGAVTTMVRFGPSVHSMVIDEGCADYLLSFETTEALRNIGYRKPGGVLLVNDESIKPLPVATGRASMPAQARQRLVAAGAKLVPASAIAQECGSIKCANVVLLGALAKTMAFPESTWEEQISAKVPPKTVDMNIQAFRAGLASVG